MNCSRYVCSTSFKPSRGPSLNGLLDDLIRSKQQRLRNDQAERARRFQVDDEIELRRLFDRQISGLCAFENLVDECRGMAINGDRIHAVANESSCFGEAPDAY